MRHAFWKQTFSCYFNFMGFVLTEASAKITMMQSCKMRCFLSNLKFKVSNFGMFRTKGTLFCLEYHCMIGWLVPNIYTILCTCKAVNKKAINAVIVQISTSIIAIHDTVCLVTSHPFLICAGLCKKGNENYNQEKGCSTKLTV